MVRPARDAPSRRGPSTLAIAGAGWAGSVHAAAAAAVPELRLTEIASRTQASASRLAAGHTEERHPVRAVVLDDLDLGHDALVVATPPTRHAALAIAALDAGTAVLVEKPLAATLDEADRMVAAAGRTAAVSGFAENLLFSPPVEVALDQCRGLGPLRHLSAWAIQPPPEWGHFLEPLVAGGVLFDLGAHPLALVLAVTSPAEPVAVRAELSSERPDGADDHARVELTFDDGLTATVEASWRADAPTWDLQVASDTGVVRLDLLPEVVVESNGLDVTPAGQAGAPDDLLGTFGYVGQLRGFVDALRGRGGRVCPLGFGRQVLEATCGAYLSAARGEPVPLPYDGPRDRTPLELWRGGTDGRVISPPFPGSRSTRHRGSPAGTDEDRG